MLEGTSRIIQFQAPATGTFPLDFSIFVLSFHNQGVAQELGAHKHQVGQGWEGKDAWPKPTEPIQSLCRNLISAGGAGTSPLILCRAGGQLCPREGPGDWVWPHPGSHREASSTSHPSWPEAPCLQSWQKSLQQILKRWCKKMGCEVCSEPCSR